MDSSSDEETTFTHRKSSTKKIFDSDDETDEAVAENLTEATEDFKLHLSDDENEDNDNVIDKSEKESNGKTATSDENGAVSEEELIVSSKMRTISPPSSPALKLGKENVINGSQSPPCSTAAEDIRKKLNALADSDSESDVDGNLQPVLKSAGKKQNVFKNRLDSDSDSDSNLSENATGKKANSVSKGKKSKAGPERKSKTNAKSAMLEIKAESQRQLRQSNIGLPYHIPKQRSLLEFLNRRKSASPMPIKGPSEQLVEIWKQIEEREKEVEEFYKSESEHDSESENEDLKQESKEMNEEAKEVVDEEAKEKINEEAKEVVNEMDTETVNEEAKEMVNEEAKEMVNEEAEEVLNEEALENSSQSKLISKESMQCEDNLDDKSNGNSVVSSVDNKLFTLKNTAIAQEAISVLNCDQKSPDEGLINGSDQTALISSSKEKPVIFADTDVTASDDEMSTEKLADVEVTNGMIEDNDTVQSDCTRVKGMKFSNIDYDKSKVSSHSQDSQDITLHLSETQSFSSEPKNVKENKGNDSNISNDIASKDESKNSKTWTELNAEMKLLGKEISDTEDDSVRVATSRQVPTLSSGPRLSLKGAPDELIDLDDMSSVLPKTPGVKGLIERFMKHSGSKKKNKSQTVELSLISSEKDSEGDVLEVKHESIKIVLSGEDNSRRDPTPGARLKLLKSELNRQMRKQKEEEWQKKQEEMQNDKVFDGEKDDCGLLPDEEEEEEMTDSEGESEPEINDVREPKKKKRLKGIFVEEEAEVDDDDNASEGSIGDGDDDSDDDDENENENDDKNDNSDNEDEDTEKDNKIVADEGEKDDQNQSVENKADNLASKPRSLRRILTSASDIFASQSTEWQEEEDEDDYIPAGQPNRLTCGEQENYKDDRSMQFSPMTLSLPSTQSFLGADQELTPPKLSWPSESKSQNSIKKLFTEPEPSSTQEKLDELAQLFAAKFNDSQAGISGLQNTSCTEESESDLMALCSGNFVTQLPEPKELEEDAGKDLNSQFLTQDSDVETSQVVKIATEDSVDFSLKWDGDLKTGEEDDESKEKFRLEIISSDEDEETVSVQEKKKKMRNRKLEFSDDEDDFVQKEASDQEFQDDDNNSEEENQDVQSKENKKLFGIFSKESREVFYDSDENEIDAGAFLEKEAELSEEEDWHGSDDEDEKGLDQLEMNEADKEDIDQDLVREQLVKNHMQKMLDEDRRDVRILQEMLLEDGELHSENGGRERQFRWRNVDSTGMGDDGHKSDEENADHEEDEDDAEWRKQRHEREMFLKEQREKQKKEAGELEENDDDLENSELLQLGKSVLFKSRSNSIDISTVKEPPAAKLSVKNNILSPDGKRNMLLSKRGSFLSRGDGVLAKLAKITVPAKENVLAGAKSSGNFVFSAISPPKKEIKAEDVETKPGKRKASAGLQNPADKKPCLLPTARKRSGLFDHL